MTRLGYRLAPGAAADLRAILRHTLRRFGPSQKMGYAELLHRAATQLAEKPERPGSRDQGRLEAGLRSFPVWLVTRRRGSSPHILFYRRSEDGVLIVRILHEAMDFAAHLAPSPDDPR